MSEKENQNENSDIPLSQSHLFENFLENQSKELSLRSEELILRKQQEQNAFSYGKEALNGKLVDRNEQRRHQTNLRKINLFFAGSIIFLLIALMVVALVVGKDQIALEIIKAVIFVSGGAAGGWGLATSKSSGKSNSKDSN